MKQQPIPEGSPNDGRTGSASQWQSWFTWVTTGMNAVVNSGPTIARPVKLLWIGRTYFDTDLGIPIWYDGTVWVDATGASV